MKYNLKKVVDYNQKHYIIKNNKIKVDTQQNIKIKIDTQ
jgi:hypothetical protein